MSKNIEKIPLPTYLFQQGIVKFDLELNSLGVLVTLAGHADGEQTFDEFVKEMSTHGPREEDKLTPFEIKRLIKDAETKELVKVIKYKTYYSIEWLPKAFGEGMNEE
ncbi:hypothetical protein ACSU64_27855 [Bacillaceae bacterium C204]|uniref:hypothetical protein n=1 Tax=Neobacillus sp. 204 TaxID=3383351 RepID=UPI00397B61BE